jgi:hypothetical protein
LNVPRPKTDTVQVTVRVPTVWTKDADAIAKSLSVPGHDLSRTDVFRMAIAAGLAKLRLDIGKKVKS